MKSIIIGAMFSVLSITAQAESIEVKQNIIMQSVKLCDELTVQEKPTYADNELVRVSTTYQTKYTSENIQLAEMKIRDSFDEKTRSYFQLDQGKCTFTVYNRD